MDYKSTTNIVSIWIISILIIYHIGLCILSFYKIEVLPLFFLTIIISFLLYSSIYEIENKKYDTMKNIIRISRDEFMNKNNTNYTFISKYDLIKSDRFEFMGIAIDLYKFIIDDIISVYHRDRYIITIKWSVDQPFNNNKEQFKNKEIDNINILWYLIDGTRL